MLDDQAPKIPPEPAKSQTSKPLERKVLAGTAGVFGASQLADIIQYFAQLPPDVAQSMSDLIIAAVVFGVGWFVRSE